MSAFVWARGERCGVSSRQSSTYPKEDLSSTSSQTSKGTMREDGWIYRLFFPNRSHSIPHRRAWNIAFRTGHLIVTSILVGGHAFHAPPDQLRPMLYLAIVTGTGMGFLETYPNLHFMLEYGGIMLIVKLALLCLIPFMWSVRFPILIVVVAIASIGSHMPRSFRNYSLLYGKVDSK
jgi:hypothetical protein